MRCLYTPCLLIVALCKPSLAWMSPNPALTYCSHRPHLLTSTRQEACLHQTSKDDNNALNWNGDDSDDLDKLMPKLGIDIGSQLRPLSEQEASDLKAAAAEIINEAVASGIDEIDKLRVKMKRELEDKRKASAFASELNAQRASEQLMDKIDKMTAGFMADTEHSRASTKLAAAADRNSKGEGIEMGVWGNVDGAAVLTSASGQSTLLGSVQSASVAAPSTSVGDFGEPVIAPPVPSLLILADVQQDSVAKALVGPLTDGLKGALPSLHVTTYKPTQTLPLGGDNADCVVLFATSLTDANSVTNALDRLLRKTMQGRTVGQPPTQLVLVSTLGTERTNKMPYSMQNLMGGKLDKRRQMEEAVIRLVRDRVSTAALDFTICKLGDVKETSEPFQLLPGDVLDGTIAIDTAVTVLTQAIAFQPHARNSTLCSVGKLAPDVSQEYLDDEFLRLDGPEVWRMDLVGAKVSDYEQLVEYISGWADLLAESGKGLTTPIRTQAARPRVLPTGVARQEGVQLLFLPTATGKNYLSKGEEMAMEKEGTKAVGQRPFLSTHKKEGGIEVVVEVKNDAIRLRAMRCNYAEDAVLKELSESTILNRLKDAIETWKKDHMLVRAN